MSFKAIEEVLGSDDSTVGFDLDDLVQDAAADMASNANNEGVSGQVDFLRQIAGWSPQEVVSALNRKRAEEG